MSQPQDDDIDYSSYMPQYVVEATVFARGAFLRGSDYTFDCAFDNILDNHEQETLGFEKSVSIPPDELYHQLPHSDSLRLLIIHPGKGDDKLGTSLKTVRLADGCAFEAISYTWGPPSDKVILSCGNGEVKVPRNLQGLLRRIRYPNRPRVVWADAVCINQNDLDERGKQVAIMRDIFKSSHRVLVWLGLDQDRDAPDVFGLVCKIVQFWRPEGDKYAFAPYTDVLTPNLDAPATNLPPLSDPVWAKLRRMFEVEYFRRFWIIQELVVPDSAVVIWGDHHIAWPLIGICSTWMQTSGWQYLLANPITASYNAFLIYILPLAKWSGISRFSKLDLAVILHLTRERFASTDDRDRIFALLGLSFSGNDPASEKLLMSPSYLVPTREIYIRAARAILQQDQHLRLLSAVHHRGSIDTSYPSWVPKWSEPQYADAIGFRSEQGYYANAGQLFYPGPNTFGADGESLFVKGLQYATVVETSELFCPHNITEFTLSKQEHRPAMLQILNDLINSDYRFRASWGTGTLEQYGLYMYEDVEKMAKSENMTVVTSENPGKYSIRDHAEMLTGERSQSDHLGDLLMFWRERSSWSSEIQHQDYRSFWRIKEKNPDAMERALSAFNVFPGRRIFRLENDKYGLGPEAMQPGDLVVVLFGAIVPHVLRPLPNGTFQLVGECFVTEIMKGKLVVNSGIYPKENYEILEDDSISMSWKNDPRKDQPVGLHGVKQFQLR